MSLATTLTQIPTDKIVPSPYQYRKTFGGPEDEDLAESVRKHGVLQPIRVRPNGKPGTFELVFGERRWRAAKAAELADVPAIVVDLGDDEVIEQGGVGSSVRSWNKHAVEKATKGAKKK